MSKSAFGIYFLLSIFFFSFNAMAQMDVPDCDTYSDYGTCIDKIHVLQSVDLAVGETFQCRISFDVCASGVYVNHYRIEAKVRGTKKRKAVASLRDVDFFLLDESTGEIDDLSDVNGWYSYDDAFAYINSGIPHHKSYIVTITNKSRKDMGLYIGAGGAISMSK